MGKSECCSCRRQQAGCGAQTSVMRAGTSRDSRQQFCLILGNKDGFKICTVDHQKDGAFRVDATITYQGDTNEVGVHAHDDEAYEHDKHFKACARPLGMLNGNLIEYDSSTLTLLGLVIGADELCRLGLSALSRASSLTSATA